MLKDSLGPTEKIVREAKISKAAIVIDWAFVPAFLLIYFIAVYLPVAIHSYVNKAALAAVAKALGMEAENVSFFRVLFSGASVLYTAIPHGLIVFADVMIGILVAVWFVWSCVRTRLHFRYELIFTEERALGRSGEETIEALWSDVQNVFIGQSVWGKLFHYGTVTLQTQRGSVTVKSICDPLSFKKEFYLRTDSFTGNVQIKTA